MKSRFFCWFSICDVNFGCCEIGITSIFESFSIFGNKNIRKLFSLNQNHAKLLIHDMHHTGMSSENRKNIWVKYFENFMKTRSSSAYHELPVGSNDFITTAAVMYCYYHPQIRYLVAHNYLVNLHTQRCFNVHLTSKCKYIVIMDVETTLKSTTSELTFYTSAALLKTIDVSLNARTSS